MIIRWTAGAAPSIVSNTGVVSWDAIAFPKEVVICRRVSTNIRQTSATRDWNRLPGPIGPGWLMMFAPPRKRAGFKKDEAPFFKDKDEEFFLLIPLLLQAAQHQHG